MIVEEIPAALAGERIDRIVALVTEASRSDADRPGRRRGGHRRRRGGHLGQGRASARARSWRSTRRCCRCPLRPCADPTIDVPVVHVDDDVIVVDKPAGLVVHPGAGHPDGTLVNGLLARFPEIAGVGEPHRPGHRPPPRRRHLRAARGGPHRRRVRRAGRRRSPPTGSSAPTGRWCGACRRTPAGLIDAPDRPRPPRPDAHGRRRRRPAGAHRVRGAAQPSTGPAS